MTNNNNLISFWKTHGETFLLVLILIGFLAYALFFAFNLKTGIIPDETAHFRFSKHFSTTIGIPADTYETYSLGWYIEQNPFLYYWINGRIINIFHLIRSDASDRQVLVMLRLINVLFSLGTVYICYLLSCQVIKKHWWRLLPVFYLTNTLMFVFLSSGVNYDNLANLFSMTGLYFLVRVLQKKDFVINSLLWITAIALGSLVKYPILPLGLVMAVVWLVYILGTRPKIHAAEFKGFQPIILSVVLLIVLSGNIAIYGNNLIRYQSITPPCQEILLESQCQVSPYVRRHKEIALERKLSIRESVEMGYPNPIQYIGNTWIKIMIMRTFGIAGHLSYSPESLVNFYRIMVYGMITLTVVNLKRLKSTTYSLIAIAVFYSIVLLIQNYNSELVYGFLHIAFQGRYIFPVIGAIYTIIPSVLIATENRYIQLGSVIFSMILFFVGGPTFVLLQNSNHFASWFI
jgi:hypothetical protein